MNLSPGDMPNSDNEYGFVGSQASYSAGSKRTPIDGYYDIENEHHNQNRGGRPLMVSPRAPSVAEAIAEDLATEEDEDKHENVDEHEDENDA